MGLPYTSGEYDNEEEERTFLKYWPDRFFALPDIFIRLLKHARNAAIYLATTYACGEAGHMADEDGRQASGKRGK